MNGSPGAAAPDASVEQRMQTTLDLFEAAVSLMRQNLRRRHPDASSEAVERLLQQWLDKPIEASSQTPRTETGA